MGLLFSLLLFSGSLIPPAVPGQPNRQPQLAARGSDAALVFGAGQKIFFALSSDGGENWSAPSPLPVSGALALGARRGPRVALADGALLVTVIAGPKGRGQDGDVQLLRSTDSGATWSPARNLNSIPGSAREGLHAMAAQGSRVAVVWLDLRQTGTRLFGAFSTDSGATWSADRLVYASPSGSVCECCHPSAAYSSDGTLFVLFRNALEGNRDMYVTASSDNGMAFGPARKLGTGTWPLNACPMDGGSLSVAPDGKPATAWRRGREVFIADLGLRESRLGPGIQPVATFTKQGRWVVWSVGAALMALPPERPLPITLAPAGAFPSLVTAQERPLAAWEEAGLIRIRLLDRP
jgi:hypothetical protein